MAMRITTKMMQNTSLRNLNINKARHEMLMNQMSTGKISLDPLMIQSLQSAHSNSIHRWIRLTSIIRKMRQMLQAGWN